MNITIICDVLGDVNNGTTLATLNLIHYLEGKGHNVTIVSPDKKTCGRENYYVVPSLNLGKFLNGYLKKNGVQLARADKRILRECIKSADVVHVQVPLFLGCAAVKIAKQMGKPVTASFHCQAENISAHIGLMNFKLFNKLVYKVFYRKVYRFCDKVHYPTEFIREVFEENTEKTNAVVISNGVNEMFFEPSEKLFKDDKFLIVASGRYSKEKAQWQLIKAVGKSRYRDKIRIILAGDGPKKEELKKLAEKYHVDCVQKFFDRPTLIKLLHSADLYVHTALIEIEAIACMEAIVCGLVPIICNSNRSATRYFAIDNNNLFEPKNIRDLTSKIEYFMDNKSVLEEYKNKYKQSTGEFALEKCMEKMEEMLISVAEESKKQGGSQNEKHCKNTNNNKCENKDNIQVEKQYKEKVINRA